MSGALYRLCFKFSKNSVSSSSFFVFRIFNELFNSFSTQTAACSSFSISEKPLSFAMDNADCPLKLTYFTTRESLFINVSTIFSLRFSSWITLLFSAHNNGVFPLLSCVVTTAPLSKIFASNERSPHIVIYISAVCPSLLAKLTSIPRSIRLCASL